MERFLAWYAVGSSVGAVAALVVANAIPLVGVLFFGWSVWTILIVYWLENGIVGAFNVLKMLRAEGDGPAPDESTPATPAARTASGWNVTAPAAGSSAKMFLIPFFIVHYGLFWFVHGIFVLTLPLFSGIGATGLDGAGILGDPSLGVVDVRSADAGADPRSIALAIVALVVSHGWSYVFNYLRSGEYRRATAASLMFAPYGRLVILHVTILLGGIAIAFTRAPVLAIVVLVLLKTAMDLGLHLREHRGLVLPLAGTA